MKKIIPVVCAVCTILSSCKKSNKENPPLPPRPGDYLLSKITDEAGRTVMDYHYDQNYHLLRADYYDTRGGGNTHTATIYTYNSQGLVDTMKVANDSFPEMNYYHIYNYDASGKLVRRYHTYDLKNVSGGLVYDYNYNSIGEIAGRSVSGIAEATFIYNAGGDMVRVDFQNRESNNYAYDDHLQPSIGIDYLPEENAFPAHFTGVDYTAASQLSRHNLVRDERANISYEYKYNQEWYPSSITMTLPRFFTYTVYLQYFKKN